MVKLRLTVNAIRTVEHNGGLDAYLLSTPDAKLPADARRLKRRIEKATARLAA
jgi:large subunit ribosomal protein L28